MITPTQPVTTTGPGSPGATYAARSTVKRSVNGPDSPQTTTSPAAARRSSSVQPTASTRSNPAAAIWPAESAERTSGTRTWHSKPRATSSSRMPATHLSWESKAAISRASGGRGTAGRDTPGTLGGGVERFVNVALGHDHGGGQRREQVGERLGRALFDDRSVAVGIEVEQHQLLRLEPAEVAIDHPGHLSRVREMHEALRVVAGTVTGPGVGAGGPGLLPQSAFGDVH